MFSNSKKSKNFLIAELVGLVNSLEGEIVTLRERVTVLAAADDKHKVDR